MDTIAHAQDLRATEAITTAARSATYRNHAYAAAALLAAILIGIAAIVWANRPAGMSPDELAAIMGRLPALKIAGGEVTLRDGATVALADGATVALREGATVNVNAPAATPAVTLPNVRDSGTGKDAIKKTVTVFSIAKFNSNRVVTGWEFEGGDAKTPARQFCYHDRANGDKTSTRVDMIVDGREPEGARAALGPIFDTALANCTWFKPGDV